MTTGAPQTQRPATGHLFATSDLHVSHRENRDLLRGLQPASEEDWLIVAGDVAESIPDLVWSLQLLAERFATVIWVPGNHELWTLPSERDGLRGAVRYRHLVDIVRDLGVTTPEDPFPVWQGPGGPILIAPLFLLYDYTFLPPDLPDKANAVAQARHSGTVCTDEYLLHPDPYPSREIWCQARAEHTSARLRAIRPDLPTVLVNHWPLTQEPTRALRHPEFSAWCGTVKTSDWHLRFRAKVVVHGHLHMPNTTWRDGVRFEEVSLGYPYEWHTHPRRPVLRRVLPEVA